MADRPTAPPTDRPLLDLSTLVTRPFLTIDGTRYEMRSPDEISVIEFIRLAALGKRLEAIEALAEPTDADVSEYRLLLETFAQCVLVAVPNEVIAALPSDQLGSVGLTFSALRAAKSLKLAGAKTQRQQEAATPAPVTSGSGSATGAS